MTILMVTVCRVGWHPMYRYIDLYIHNQFTIQRMNDHSSQQRSIDICVGFKIRSRPIDLLSGTNPQQLASHVAIQGIQRIVNLSGRYRRRKNPQGMAENSFQTTPTRWAVLSQSLWSDIRVPITGPGDYFP